MIFFFSATGNSQYAAQRIADACGERTVSIADCVKNGEYHFSLQPGEMLGFVTPVYVTCLPSVVVDFLRQFEVDMPGDHYVWHAVTYGRVPGNVSKQLALLLSEKDITLQAAFDIKVLSNYTILFDLTDTEEVAEKVAAAEAQIDNVIGQIKDGTVNEGASLPSPEETQNLQEMQDVYDKIRKTGPFHVEASCDGCGLCAGICPCGVIRIEEGRPVWTKEVCAMCLGCLHRCPRFAIQYSDRTAEHGQYTHPAIHF